MTICVKCGTETFARMKDVGNTLCKRCAAIWSQYLLDLEKQQTRFFKEGVFLESPKASSEPAASAASQLACYRKVNVPGKDSCVLGKGAFGEVWLMQHKITKDFFAMKIVDKKRLGNGKAKAQSSAQRMEQEIDIQSRLKHDNIIQLYKYMSDPEHIYLIMEYASRGSLFFYIRDKGRLSEHEAFEFFAEVCSAVHFIHKHGFVHRDIKPENILISAKGRLKLCDFGSCAPYDEDHERYHRIIHIM